MIISLFFNHLTNTQETSWLIITLSRACW